MKIFSKHFGNSLYRIEESLSLLCLKGHGVRDTYIRNEKKNKVILFGI